MDILTKVAFIFGLVVVILYLMVIIFITAKAVLQSGEQED